MRWEMGREMEKNGGRQEEDKKSVPIELQQLVYNKWDN